jgi:hypothetical protein
LELLLAARIPRKVPLRRPSGDREEMLPAPFAVCSVSRSSSVASQPFKPESLAVKRRSEKL